jgi:hypothetical protein
MLNVFYHNGEVVSVPEFSQDEITVLRKIKVLGKATPDTIAQELGDPYTPQDLSVYLKSLEKRALLNRTQENPSVYQLTPLGFIAIGAMPQSAKKIYLTVPTEKCFHFYTGVGPDKFTKMSACSLHDFKEKAKTVDPRSLEFHVKRGDIAKWLTDVVGDAELSREFDRLKTSNLSGEVLRTRVLRLIDARIERLTQGGTRF